MEAVAYGPPLAEPNCPKFVVVKGDGLYLRANRGKEPDEEVSLTTLLGNGEVCKLERPLPWRPGHWLVNDGGPSWIPAGEVDLWKEKQAKLLMSQALSFKEDPERRIAVLKMAARVAEVPIEELMGRLEHSKNRPDEPLDEVYRRVRGL